MTEDSILENALAIRRPEERHRFLLMICGGDDVLLTKLQTRIQEIERSAGIDTEEQPRLRQAAVDRTVVVTATDAADAAKADEADETLDTSFLQPPSKPGSLGRLGHYEVIKVLGHGAFGTVFLAFDEKLHRRIAIKAMHPQLAVSSPPRKRFLKEARAVAAMSHENIVTIYAVEEHPIPFLAMELISGKTLQEKLRESGPVDVPEILHIGRQIAAGLAAAHAKNLIHRDVKPGNILLEETAEQKVKITDFGLARAIDDASASRSGGGIAGTPMYMSPEQALGKTVDFRSDLFSLGSVLYEMASGRAPFRATSAVAVLKRVVDDVPRPISEIIPETPLWLCTIIEKLQAKNPEDRFQTAQEVADLLARCQMQLATRNEVSISTGDPRPPIPASRTEHKKSLVWPVLSFLSLIVALVAVWLNSPVNPSLGPSSTAAPETPVSITRVKVSAPSDDASVMAEATTPSPSEADHDADREAARWAIDAGATLVLGTDLGRMTIAPGESVSLDKSSFKVLEIRRPQNVRWEEEDLQCLRGLESLEVLDLFQGRPGIAALKNIASVSSLRELTLQRCSLTDESCLELAPLTGLTTLVVSDNGLTDQSFDVFREFRSLRKLWIGNNLIHGTRFSELAVCTELSDLDLLGLAMVEGWSRQLRALPHLSLLNLHGCNATDEDLRELTSTHEFANLILNYTPITDRAIEGLLAESTLRLLHLVSTSISQAGLEKLSAGMASRGGPVPHYDRGIPNRLSSALTSNSWTRMDLSTRVPVSDTSKKTNDVTSGESVTEPAQDDVGTFEDGRLRLGAKDICRFPSPVGRNMIVRVRFRFSEKPGADGTQNRAWFRLRDRQSGACVASIQRSGPLLLGNALWGDGRADMGASWSSPHATAPLDGTVTVIMAVFDSRSYLWCNDRFLVLDNSNPESGTIGLGWLDDMSQMVVEELEYQVLDEARIE